MSPSSSVHTRTQKKDRKVFFLSSLRPRPLLPPYIHERKKKKDRKVYPSDRDPSSFVYKKKVENLHVQNETIKQHKEIRGKALQCYFTALKDNNDINN